MRNRLVVGNRFDCVVLGKSNQINPGLGLLFLVERSWSVVTKEGGGAMEKCWLLLLLIVTTWWSWLPMGGSIWLNLPSSGTKCVSEEIQANVVALADYAVLSLDRNHQIPTISTKVTSPYGNNLHHRENVTSGEFAFTTSESGNYLACFWLEGHNPSGLGASVNLDWRVGIAAKDWESVARKEKLEGVELELRKLEGAVEAIHENLLYLRSRETVMRDVSELTNSRVAWFSIMSLAVCILVSGLNLWHLKHFFRKKKLI